MIKAVILSQGIAQIPINLTMVLNPEETNPFQVSVIEIIDQLEESILEEVLQVLQELSMEVRVATL